MNATNLYMNTCRLVMQVDIKSEDILCEFNKLLPYLRQSLSCIICGKILINPYYLPPNSCQHYACKMCIVKNQSKLSCSECNDHHGHNIYTESSQVRLILKCYRKLCSYIKNTSLYDQLSGIKTNRNNCNLSLTDIIDEALTDHPNGLNNPEDSNIGLVKISQTEVYSDEPDSYSSDITDNDEDKIVTSTTVSDEGIDIVLPLDQSSREDYFTNSEDNTAFKSDFIKLEGDTDILEDHRETRLHFCKSYSHEDSHCDSPLLTVDSSDIAPIVEIPLSHCSVSSVSPIKDFGATSNFIRSDDISGSNSYTRPTDELYTLDNPDPDTDDHFEEKFEPIYNEIKSPVAVKEEIIKFEDNVDNDNIPVPSSSLPSVTRYFPRIYNGVNISNSSAVDIVSVNRPIPRDTDSFDDPLSFSNTLKSNIPSINDQQYSGINDLHNIKIRPNSNVYNPPVSIVNSLIPSLGLSSIPNMSNCIFNIQSGTILTGANVKEGVRESILKQNPVHTNSSVYSVMYNNNDSTKITIKRKPPDLENVNQMYVAPDKVILNSQIIPKRVKPKPKPKPKRKGCRCGNATQTPGKLTCCGQRCPCYVEAKACLECQCRGCRNPHRPGGKKVRPIIPQLGNIQIHQVQPVHQKLLLNNSSCITGNSLLSISNTAPIITSGGIPIRTVHTMHNVHGVSQLHNMPTGMHHLINIGNRTLMDTSSISTGIHSDMTLKPVNISLQSVPTQLLMKDEKSTSTSDNSSDIDI